MGSVHVLPVAKKAVSLSDTAVMDHSNTMAEHTGQKSNVQNLATPSTAEPIQSSSKQQRYEKLVQLYHADLYRYGYWLCKDGDIAQDLVQETYLRAWKSLDSLLDPAAAKAWLITILRRENARRFERKQFDYDDATEQDLLVDHAQISAEQFCDNHIVREQIAALHDEYREPLVLQAIGGFNSDEIANMLQLNVNTVNTRLFRARNLLRQKLQFWGGSKDE